MRLLLDTNVLIWLLAEPRRVAKGVRERVRDAGIVAVSAASVWEIAIKSALGKLMIPDDLEEHLEAQRYSSIPVTAKHALAVADLPPIHSDPFDRMLVAQARCERMTLVTADERILGYDVDCLDSRA